MSARGLRGRRVEDSLAGMTATKGVSIN
jgi:hypothetical protein